ncbi:MAG TPA: hypothetical protein VIL46_13565, partial [Gemmataceae bacterium]
LSQVTIDPSAIRAIPPTLRETIHPFAVVLTQDCDLEQDFRVRFPEAKPSDKLIPGVLFCEVATAEELFGIIRQTNKKLWDRIKISKDERYHFLQKVDPSSDLLNEGLPELAIDFKRYFTIPTDEVYRRIEVGEAKRRCVLVSPYLEHLSSRFAYFLSRVALPEDHFSEPGGARQG